MSNISHNDLKSITEPKFLKLKKSNIKKSKTGVQLNENIKFLDNEKKIEKISSKFLSHRKLSDKNVINFLNMHKNFLIFVRLLKYNK